MSFQGARLALVGGVVAAAIGANAPAALAQNPTAGRTVFINTGCGSCHTFAAAGTSGTIATNFDQKKPTYNRAVTVVTNGITTSAGAMPAYAGVLSSSDIQNVAAFVSGTAAPAQTTPAQTTPAPTTPAPTTPAPTTPAQTTPAPTTPAPSPAPSPAPATPEPAEPAPTGALPSTGFDVVPVLVLAAALSAIGLALVFWRPRRKGLHD